MSALAMPSALAVVCLCVFCVSCFASEVGAFLFLGVFASTGSLPPFVVPLSFFRFCVCRRRKRRRGETRVEGR